MPPSADRDTMYQSDIFDGDLSMLGMGFPSPKSGNGKYNAGASPGRKTRNSGLLRTLMGKSPKADQSKPKQDDLEILAQKFNLIDQHRLFDMQREESERKLEEDSQKFPTRRQTISLGSPTPTLPSNNGGKTTSKMARQMNTIFSRNLTQILPRGEREREREEERPKEKDRTEESKAYQKVKAFFSRKSKVGESEDTLEDEPPRRGGSHEVLGSSEFPRSRSAVFYPFNPNPEEGREGGGLPAHVDLSKSMQLDGGGRHISASRKAFRERFQMDRTALLEGRKEGDTLRAELVRGPLKRQGSGSWSEKLPWLGFKAKSMNLAGTGGGMGKYVVSPEDSLLADRFACGGDEACAAGSFDVAVVEYSRAIDKRPLDAELVLCRASALYKMGCYVEALADAMRAIGLNPTWPKPHYQLGLVYKFLGDYKSAVQAFRTALELEPNPPPSLVALTLKAESVLSMPATDKSRAAKSSLPEASALSFQPSGLPLPRSKAGFFSGMNLNVPVVPLGGADLELDSPLCSPSGGEGVSPFSFSSGESQSIGESNLSVIHRSAMGSGTFLVPALALPLEDASGKLPGPLEGGSTLLALGMADGGIGLWETDTWQQVQSLNFHCDRVTHLEWSEDGTVLASASGDGLVCLWESRGASGEVARDDVAGADWENRTVSFTDLAAAGEFATANAGAPHGTKGVDGGKMRLKLMLDCQGADVSALCFSESGANVVAACGDHKARVWSVQSGGQLAVLEHPGPVTAVAFSLDDAFLVTAGVDGQLRVWDLQQKRRLCSFSAKSIVSMHFCGAPGRQFLATCHQSSPSSLEGFVCLWQVSLSDSSGAVKVEEVSRICAQGRIFASELRRTSEGGVIATLAQLDGSLNICSLNPSRRGDQQLRVLYPQKNSACLSRLSLTPCGRFFAGLTIEKKVCLWSVADGRLKRVIAE